jgi:hypothetical protein
MKCAPIRGPGRNPEKKNEIRILKILDAQINLIKNAYVSITTFIRIKCGRNIKSQPFIPLVE